MGKGMAFSWQWKYSNRILINLILINQFWTTT